MRSKKKQNASGSVFFLLGTLSGDVICLMRHSGTRGAKKKTRPCDFLVRTDALKTPLGTYVQNFEDTPGAGIMTPQKQREGGHLRPEFRRRSTRQRHDSPKTTRGSPFTPRISRTLHTPASRQAENNERVTTFCYGHARSFHARLGASTKEGSLTAFWMLS